MDSKSIIIKLSRLLRHDWPLHFTLLFTNWLPDNVLVLRLRGILVAPFLGSCGSDLRIGRNVSFYNPALMHIGSHVYIAYGCVFLANSRITLEDEVVLGPYIVFAAGNHTRKARSFRYGPRELAPIIVGAGTWIGAHTTVLGGATIGRGCLVASNSAVTRGIIPNDVVVAGAPKQIKKHLHDDQAHENSETTTS
jgi:maltose O-acetyltransferase